MPRPPSLWLRARDKCWMTTVNGTQHKLSKDKAEARRLLYALLGGTPPAGPPPAPGAPPASGLTLAGLCDDYLDKTAGRVGAERQAVRVFHLSAVCRKFGTRDPMGLKAHEVEDWLEGETGWGPSTRWLHATVLRAALNWAARRQQLPANPLATLRRGSVGRRGRVLDPAERAAVLGTVSPAFADFLRVLEQTGCRPFSEAAKLTAADVDFAKGRAVLAEHKNAAKGKARAVYFPPALLARLRELAAARPAGPLLRNRAGGVWEKRNVSKYLARAAARVGLAPFTAYAFRTGYVTDALAKGVPVEVVAELTGTSPRTIWKHYNSLDRRHDALAAAALKAVS